MRRTLFVCGVFFEGRRERGFKGFDMEGVGFVGGGLVIRGRGLGCGRVSTRSSCHVVTSWLRTSVSAIRLATGTSDVRALLRHRRARDSLNAQLEDLELPEENSSLSKLLMAMLVSIRCLQRMTAVIPNIQSIPSWMYRRRYILRGRVVDVPDGDNFVMLHSPRFSFQTRSEDLDFADMSFREVLDKSIRIRLAGVDAPEGAFKGGAGQAYYTEAKEYLCNALLGKTVTVELLGRDR